MSLELLHPYSTSMAKIIDCAISMRGYVLILRRIIASKLLIPWLGANLAQACLILPAGC